MSKSSDIAFSKVINSLNSVLKKAESSLYIENKTPQTTIQVIGAPRSGTTLLTQLILTNLDVGHISNLAAVFWDAPLFGIHISKKLLGYEYKSKLNSSYGSTAQINEPHEFSFFWKKQLNYPDFLQRTYDENHHIDWETLRERLYQMSLAFKKPIVYKAFQLGFHAAEAVQQMPKTVFIHIERDIYQNAYSILKLRMDQNGNEEDWASIKPVQFNILKKENKYRQIIGQILFLNFEYRKQLLQIPEENKLIINYSDLCTDTKLSLLRISNKVNNHQAVTYKYVEQHISEIKKTIPEEILKGFQVALKWVYKKFPELINKD